MQNPKEEEKKYNFVKNGKRCIFVPDFEFFFGPLVSSTLVS